MAKSVLDAGWSMSRNALRYKASRHGGTFREVDEVSTFTTQTCSMTGILPPKRPRGIAGLGMRAPAASSGREDSANSPLTGEQCAPKSPPAIRFRKSQRIP